VKDTTHDIIIKVLAVLFGLGAIIRIANSFAGDGGVFSKAFWLLAGLFYLVTAIGFARYKGWAFLVISVSLLIGFLTRLVGFILAIDRGDGTAGGYAMSIVITVCLIGYLGRWSMERRFRPELDIEH
jgi:hypothetical protein